LMQIGIQNQSNYNFLGFLFVEWITK
jgi:hypothetical protein